MSGNEVRKKYLQFFKNRGHAIISPAPLVLDNDPTTLFTSSGMQPLVPYLMGEPHAEGKRLVNSQPSIRVQDIEDVGDNRHTTFFEMLGNWSLGDYFKKEQLAWVFEFLTDPGEGLGLDPKKLYVSVFEGDENVPKDDESISIWKEIFSKVGIEAQEGERIFTYPAEKNWWSRSGTPNQMPEGEIGGPDSEVFFDFGEELKIHENSQWKDQTCHPNCDCGRFMEIGNSVFIQYKKQADGTLTPLPNKNVDFGGGFERLTAATINSPDIFKIDIFECVIDELEKVSGKSYKDPKFTAAMRIIADHLRAACFLVKSGVIPSNKAQGYILRRLLRRSAVKIRELRGDLADKTVFNAICAKVVENYEGIYFDNKDAIIIAEVVGLELEKFIKTLERGLKELHKIDKITGKLAFDLYQTYGFPLELTLELAEGKGDKVDKAEFAREFEKHQNLSRTASAGTFKGGLADHSSQTTALHTATHLLHASLRKILGEHVSQKGSNVTAERLRFDFTHSDKLTAEEKKDVEDLVNAQIGKDLPVSFEIMTLEEAKEKGALAFFGERYGEKVKVYTIGEGENPFSREVCGGPHVNHLSEIGGRVTIVKEESAGANIRRLYAQIKKQS